MIENLIINLREEAEYIHDTIYRNMDIIEGHKNGFYVDIEGYLVQSLDVMELIKYLYHGVRDRSGSILIWAIDDVNDRERYLVNNTRFKNKLPPNIELMACSFIDKTITQYLSPYLLDHGSQYSTLLFTFVSDSLAIGVGPDVRIIEWEEACRSGKIKPAWLPNSYLARTSKYITIGEVRAGSAFDAGLASGAGLVSDDPELVNEAILSNQFTH
jgi:hypothetical protein